MSLCYKIKTYILFLILKKCYIILRIVFPRRYLYIFIYSLLGRRKKLSNSLINHDHYACKLLVEDFFYNNRCIIDSKTCFNNEFALIIN